MNTIDVARWMESRLPPTVGARGIDRYRARMLLLISTVGALACLTFAALNLLDSRLAVACVDGAGALLLTVNVLGFLRGRLLFRWAVHGVSLVGLAVIALASYVLGGGPQNYSWLMVPMLAATFLGGWRIGAVFMVLGLATMAAFAGLRAEGFAFPGHSSAWFDFALAAGAAVVGWLFVAAYDRLRDEQMAALDAARQEAEAAHKVKAAFLAHMSHELRTPMNGVLGMTQLLACTSLSPEQTRALHILGRSAESLLRVIDDVLDFSKIEADKLTIEVIDFDPRELLDDVVTLLRPVGTGGAVRLVATIDEAVPRALRGDPTRLRQVLFNLVGNAMKFTPQGEVKVALGPSGSAWRLSVSDTGIGIAADRLTTIFQSFTQADSSTTRRFGGTGLGLTITRSLVNAMGGQLTVESQEGAGSTFTVEIPLAVGSLPAEEAVIVPPPAPTNGAVRVLVAEDNAVNRAVIGGMLARLGYACDVVSNGREAVLSVAKGSHDIVLMDCQMPVLDGFDASREIRALVGPPRRTPIIAVTASVLEDDRARCLAAGMDEVLPKPFSLADLGATIERQLARSKPGEPASA